MPGDVDPELHEAQHAEWPNMCAVIEKQVRHPGGRREHHALTNNTEQEVAGYPINVYAGGASLISPRFLLTAAHIFNTDGQYAIRSV